MNVYYPSCNFQGLFPETAARIRKYLLTRPDAVIAGCCHKTQDLPGSGDTILAVCMSCMLCLRETRPDVPRRSLFEYILEDPDFRWPDLSDRTFVLQDCFRARGMHALQDAVRACLARCGARILEMPGNRDEEEYDGGFRYHLPKEAPLKDAPKYFGETLTPYLTLHDESEWTERFREHARLYQGHSVVCYCNTCTSSAKQGGADAYHLAELLFPET